MAKVSLNKKLVYLFLGGRILLLSSDKLRGKSRATIILPNFVNKPKPNSYWFTFFRPYLSLVKI